MKPSEILIRAAELMDDPDEMAFGCCEALSTLAGWHNYDMACFLFASLFRPETAGPRDYWFGDVCFQRKNDPCTRAHRVYALLLAAEVAKDEE